MNASVKIVRKNIPFFAFGRALTPVKEPFLPPSRFHEADQPLGCETSVPLTLYLSKKDDNPFLTPYREVPVPLPPLPRDENDISRWVAILSHPDCPDEVIAAALRTTCREAWNAAINNPKTTLEHILASPYATLIMNTCAGWDITHQRQTPAQRRKTLANPPIPGWKAIDLLAHLLSAKSTYMPRHIDESVAYIKAADFANNQESRTKQSKISF